MLRISVHTHKCSHNRHLVEDLRTRRDHDMRRLEKERHRRLAKAVAGRAQSQTSDSDLTDESRSEGG